MCHSISGCISALERSRSPSPIAPSALRISSTFSADIASKYRRDYLFAVATWDHVRRLALAMPEAAEKERSNGLRAWTVKDKLFVWERPLRGADLRALGAAAPKGPILGARVEHEIAKQAMIQSEPDIFFTTPHFEGYPAVLIRLKKISVK